LPTQQPFPVFPDVQGISNIGVFSHVFSGFCVSATRLSLPDVGLISYGEMVDQGRLINEAVSIPVLGDGDNGYGNSMGIKRTIKGYINAGFAGIMLEDQVPSHWNTNQSFHIYIYIYILPYWHLTLTATMCS
jgi:2-methylisocitrate lyase-like PEP mutase family enzyme